jgi:hypothetical protein
VRRHLRRLGERGLLTVEEEAISPLYVPDLLVGTGWRRVRAGLATVYAFSFAALGLEHMGERHRSRPSSPESACGALASATSADENSLAVLKGQPRWPLSPGECVRSAAEEGWEGARDIEPDHPPPERSAGESIRRLGLAWDGSRYVNVFPMSEGSGHA